jgi:ketosteroid isomerase-like protein
MSSTHELLQTFEKVKTALFSCDVQALEELMAEDYVGFDPRGERQDRQSTLEAYAPGGVKLDRYDVHDVETKIFGDVGVITGKGYIHGTFGESAFEHDLRFLDMYVMRDGRWQLAMTQVTPLSLD